MTEAKHTPGPLPEGDRFADALKFRRLGEGGGNVLYECWGDAVRAYAAQEVAAERERCARICDAEADKWQGAGSVMAERRCAALIRKGPSA